MKKTNQIIAISVMFFFIVGAICMDCYTYVVNSGSTVTVGWNNPGPCNYFKVYLHQMETNKLIKYAENIPFTNAPSYEYAVVVPKVGHWEFRVAACNTETTCAWSTSIDAQYAVVNGQPKAWQVYAKLAPPGPIQINQKGGDKNIMADSGGEEQEPTEPPKPPILKPIIVHIAQYVREIFNYES